MDKSIKSTLDSNFENKNKMLDIACEMLSLQNFCPLEYFNDELNWECDNPNNDLSSIYCVRCIRLCLKYLAQKKS